MAYIKRVFYQILGVLIFVNLCLSCSGTKDYVLVVDTSGSMSTGERIIVKIRDNISDFMERLNVGDTISIMGFASRPRFYGTFTIQKEGDRIKPIRKVRSLQARGAYTDMQAMLRSLARVGKKVKGAGRQLIVVVMSDGLDDPPPWKKRSLLRLESWRKSGSFLAFSEEPYVYYVNLGKLRDDKLVQGLSRFSPHLKEIGGSQTAGLKELGEDIEAKLFWRTLLLFLTVLFILALIILAWWLYLRQYKLRGVLEYYDVNVGPSLKGSYRLEKVNSSCVMVGRKPGANLKIREFGSKINFTLRGRRRKKTFCLKPKAKDLDRLSFERQCYKGVICPGDVFTVENFKFEYK